uniref:Broad substrate specificity ATP-binding cassette transporter ABCG2 n=1 Tax=Cyclopterus lumpus TaxID=8103 RepID=A0A8C2WMG1_CYCLU
MTSVNTAKSFHGYYFIWDQGGQFIYKSAMMKSCVSLSCSGTMRPGLNAILGPTGSGKSSFLDILAARKDPSGLFGEVLIDKAPQPPNFKCLAGYVVQEDVVMGTLTVRENLRFSAALRLPSSVLQSEKEARVNHLIEELGLTKVADSKVGTPMTRGISGGERKKTNIGMELITDPSVLFLDEPTTGLDASTANSVLLLLKRMASHGRTIIMSIHQPRYSIYRLFDTLTLLVAGKMIYHGPAPDALNYFANIGEDYFQSLSSCAWPDLDFEELIRSRQSIEENLVEEYRNSSYSSDTRAELERIVQEKKCISDSTSHNITYNSSFFHQLRWVLMRTFQNLMLNPQTSVAQRLNDQVLFFCSNRTGVLFFMTINQCFSTLSSAELFIIERKLFVHEYISGYYRVSVYFLSQILSDITLRTITSVIFSAIVYFMIGLKSTAEAFFIFTLTVTLVGYTATAMTMAISADQSFVALANIYITITFIFMMIFSGLLVNLPSMEAWLAWLRYFSIPRYAFINEFVGLNFCDEAVIRNREQYLDYMGIEYTTWGLWENHVALTVMMFIFLIIAYLKLRYIKKFT